MKKLKEIIPLILLTVIPTALVWLPFFLRVENFWNIPLARNGMATIVANYDGPLYLVVAKTLYNLHQIAQNYQFPLPLEYYAAHFPLFPILIRTFSSIFGYPYSMLFTTVISSFLAIFFFNKLIRKYVKPKDALWLTFLFAIFPGRWLVVRSVGSAEPLFIASIIASIFYFTEKKYLWAAVWGVVAQLTKSPAILLFVAYFGSITIPQLSRLITGKFKSINLKPFPLLLIPISLLGIFFFFGSRETFGDFYAYFHSGDNIHLLFPPFQIFNYSAPWVGTFWLEEVIFIYLFGAVTLLTLIKKKYTEIAWFVGIFFATLIFVSHRDLLRYALPIVPFVFVAFHDLLIKKEIRYIFVFLIIPTYLFSLAFISQNVMPISNWAPFL